MKPETERLLHQCRSALLQQSNEQLHTLFVSWFERLVGEESTEETLDDLCLLLGYGIRSVESRILYATSTAWWEVEGCADLDGEFECVEVSALQHRLIAMPIKQFALLADLAYHVCVLEAEVEGQPHPRPVRNGCVPWLPGSGPGRGNLSTTRANVMRHIPFLPRPKPS
jgi:hypothetical protein